MIFSVIVLIYSAIIHEYMHGWMADRLGDPTAKLSGRLTLNPISHIDPFGSILLPLLMIVSNIGFVFGWAKPVPFNPYNLKDQKYGIAKVGAAGALANLATAMFFGLLIRLTASFAPGFALANTAILSLMQIVVFINILLAVFNLLPIPPLDGSKVIAPFLPYSWQVRFAHFEQYGMILVLLFVMFGFQLLYPLIGLIFRLFTGLPL